ncbi:hypothetical protein AMTR_s00097p00112990 [Amborella trichopoda]|uniref:Uncharacterized protein n=1 Tax=Amborella trichopoda TaxID=13333 RepID=W1P2F2_AMBTC|nr:hypothetical protein AMTR_s00097p00112990 [Amborella trichopoda]
MPTHSPVETRILRIPASFPKVGIVSTARKELDLSLRVVQILASLRKHDDIPTRRVSVPPNHLKGRTLQISKVLSLTTVGREMYEANSMAQSCHMLDSQDVQDPSASLSEVRTVHPEARGGLASPDQPLVLTRQDLVPTIKKQDLALPNRAGVMEEEEVETKEDVPIKAALSPL